jgi:hypothetical protein
VGQEGQEAGAEGQKDKTNMYKVHVDIVAGRIEEEEATGSAWTTESNEDSDVGSCK